MNKLFCLLLFLLCTEAFTQSIKDSVAIGKVEKFYKNSDSISISMENKSCQKIYIQISLEREINKKWNIVLPDIFRTNESSMVDNILYLNCHEKRSELWNPIEFAKRKKNVTGKFRFKLNVGYQPDNLIYYINSSSFLLKKG